MPDNKHVLETPATLVVDALKGVAAINPQVLVDEGNKTVYVRNQDKSKVAVVAGGGAGHEPSFSGFVGSGMLTAAVSGNVFASPNVGQIRAALERVHGTAGTLIIVLNYTGDALHFGLAKESHSVSHPNIDARLIIVGDDVSVGRAQGGITGRRGLAGTVLVAKLAGAMAKRGKTFEQVYQTAKWVSENVATYGVGLEHCHVPGTANAEAHLASDELELGMGIHNEPGVKKLKVPPRSQLVSQLLETLTSTTDPDRSFLPFKGKDDEAVLLVNNLGGMSEVELAGIAGEAVKWFNAKKSIKLRRVISGQFMTSLSMPGFSFTLLLLPSSSHPSPPPTEVTTDLILELLDERVEAPGWKWTAQGEPGLELGAGGEEVQLAKKTTGGPKLEPEDEKKFVAALRSAATEVIAAEPEITRFDTIAGDGDCGLTLKAGAEGILNDLKDSKIDSSNVIASILTISEIVEKQMGGTSGALYSLFFNALGGALQKAAKTSPGVKASRDVWASASAEALQSLYQYTRARPPSSRTLVDPLGTFIEAFVKGDSLQTALQKAEQVTEEGKKLRATAGRAAYVNQDNLKEAEVPDPGAVGVCKIIEGISKAQ